MAAVAHPTAANTEPKSTRSSTVRFAVELGYEVTMVRDATADYSDENMRAALDVNIPSYASAIVTAAGVVESLGSVVTV